MLPLIRTVVIAIDKVLNADVPIMRAITPLTTVLVHRRARVIVIAHRSTLVRRLYA